MTKATLYSFFPGFSVRFAALIERPLPKKGPSAFTAVIIEVFVNDLSLIIHQTLVNATESRMVTVF